MSGILQSPQFDRVCWGQHVNIFNIAQLACFGRSQLWTHPSCPSVSVQTTESFTVSQATHLMLIASHFEFKNGMTLCKSTWDHFLLFSRDAPWFSRRSGDCRRGKVIWQHALSLSKDLARSLHCLSFAFEVCVKCQQTWVLVAYLQP